MTSCSQLEVINIASNSFVSLPPVLLDIPTLAKIDAKKNFIAGTFIDIYLFTVGKNISFFLSCTVGLVAIDSELC